MLNLFGFLTIAFTFIILLKLGAIFRQIFFNLLSSEKVKGRRKNSEILLFLLLSLYGENGRLMLHLLSERNPFEQ